MIRQSKIHNMILDEIREFNKLGLEPNRLVISTNLLQYMEKWDMIDNYYTPASQIPDGRGKYLGLVITEAVPEHSDDKTRTPGTCYVCCGASSGKVKDIHT